MRAGEKRSINRGGRRAGQIINKGRKSLGQELAKDIMGII